MSVVNHRFGVARSLPSLLVVPGKISDDSLQRFSKVYKQGCFPCITWQHPDSRALLLRGASYHVRSMMHILRQHQNERGVSWRCLPASRQSSTWPP